jgi:hypothetical protein
VFLFERGFEMGRVDQTLFFTQAGQTYPDCAGVRG